MELNRIYVSEEKDKEYNAVISFIVEGFDVWMERKSNPGVLLGQGIALKNCIVFYNFGSQDITITDLEHNELVRVTREDDKLLCVVKELLGIEKDLSRLELKYDYWSDRK